MIQSRPVAARSTSTRRARRPVARQARQNPSEPDSSPSSGATIDAALPPGSSATAASRVLAPTAPITVDAGQSAERRSAVAWTAFGLTNSARS